MAFQVVISTKARIRLYEISTWWGENRSREQAVRWLDGWRHIWHKLSIDPHDFPLIAENEQLGIDARNCFYGLGARKTHRAVFTVVGSIVIVHTIRHLAQDDLKSDDLKS